MHVLFVFDRLEKGFNSGIGALSAFLKLHGHTCRLLIVDRNEGEEEFKRSVSEIDPPPGLAAFTVMTFQWERVKILSRWLKEVLDVPVLCGGYHPTVVPEEVIQHPHVDGLCRGEGEIPLLKAVEGVERGRDISGVESLWIKGDSPLTGKNGIFRNPTSSLIADLDRLPFWDREIFPFENFYNKFGEITFFQTQYTMPLAAGRGCPYNCTFCCNEYMRELSDGPYLRRRSVSSILAELKYLATNFPIQAFEFWDEQFETDLTWLEKFVEAYHRELGFPFLVGLRPENAKPQVLSLLKKANCRLIAYGVEAGNEEYRQKVLLKKNTNEQIFQAFQNSREGGISTVSLNMLGLPEETPGLAMETLELNLKIQPDYVLYSAFQPFPGTRLYGFCRERGYLKETTDYMYHHAQYALNQPSMSEEEFMDAWKKWKVFEEQLDQKAKKKEKNKPRPL